MLASDEELNEVAFNAMPEANHAKDEADRQLHCVRAWGKARKSEFIFQESGQFRTKGNVVADRNCGYHALMVALNYINRTCKETLREVRKNIWVFSMNCKY